MKIIHILLIAIVAILSAAAGLAKVLQAPPEMEFLQGLGLNPALILIFGLVQVTGGVLLVLQKTRRPGAILAGLGFAVSAILVFMNGNMQFGLISLVPLILAGFVFYRSGSINQPS